MFARRRLISCMLMVGAGLLATAPLSASTERIISLEFRDPGHTGTPVGWERVSNTGRARSKVKVIDGRTALQVETTRGHVRFEHGVNVGTPQRLQVSWDWWVDRMPGAPLYKPWNDGGRKTLYVSNAPIQVLVVFQAGISTYHVIHYLWDPAAEAGYSWVEKETAYGFVKLTYPRLVLRSGKTGMGQWHHEVRDVVADHRRFFPGEPVPPSSGCMSSAKASTTTERARPARRASPTSSSSPTDQRPSAIRRAGSAGFVGPARGREPPAGLRGQIKDFLVSIREGVRRAGTMARRNNRGKSDQGNDHPIGESSGRGTPCSPGAHPVRFVVALLGFMALAHAWSLWGMATICDKMGLCPSANLRHGGEDKFAFCVIMRTRRSSQRAHSAVGDSKKACPFRPF